MALQFQPSFHSDYQSALHAQLFSDVIILHLIPTRVSLNPLKNSYLLKTLPLEQSSTFNPVVGLSNVMCENTHDDGQKGTRDRPSKLGIDTILLLRLR